MSLRFNEELPVPKAPVNGDDNAEESAEYGDKRLDSTY